MKTFSELRARNIARCESASGFNHLLHDWSLSDWMTAAAGELGEAANVVKKLNRHRDGIHEPISREALEEMLADEIADTVIYLDLLCARAGFDLGCAVGDKFQRTSQKIGYEE